MKVTVLLFGPQAQIAGRREVTLDVGGGSATADQVLSALGEAVPKIRESLRKSRLAVNSEFAADGTVIRPGDEVALIGMVSGG